MILRFTSSPNPCVRDCSYSSSKDSTPSALKPYRTPSNLLRLVLASAGANAEFKNYSKEDLFVAEAYANEGPTYKRWWPRSHGSADQILKRTSHITIILDEKKIDLNATKPARKQATATTSVDVAGEAKEQVKEDAVKAKETAKKAPAKKATSTKTSATKKTTTATKKTTAAKSASTTKGGAK